MKVSKIIKSALVVIILLIGIGGAVETIQFVPDYAIVYIDTDTRTYYSPMGLTQDEINNSNLIKSTLGDAEMLGCKMNDTDKRNEYFYAKGSMAGNFLRDLGILPSKDRVDCNGNWLY